MIDEKILKKIKPGTKVRVFEKKTTPFEGLVIAHRHGTESGASVTVRSTVSGVGVEKTYPIHSPIITKVEVVSQPKRRVRRAKLYYIRDLSTQKIRKKLGISA